MIAWLAGIIFLLAIDRILKQWAIAELYNKKITIIKKIFSLELFKNENIAFSIYLPETIILAVIIAVIILLIFILIWRLIKFSKQFTLIEAGLLLVIIGAVSNLSDRLQFGFVVDYFNLTYWPVFNLADVMISAGVLILGWMLWQNKIKTV